VTAQLKMIFLDHDHLSVAAGNFLKNFKFILEIKK
jgi:hypothetical protein